MNPRRTLDATFWAMIALQTIASVDLPGKPKKGSPLGGQGTRKLPSPRVYVAVVVLWAILGLVADATSFGRAAARLSLLVLLTGAVLGPFGSRAIAFLETVARNFAIPPAPPGQQPGAGESTATQAALGAVAEGVIV